MRTPPQQHASLHHRRWVRRETILSTLKRHTDTRIVLFAAPAGFGKSTTMAAIMGGNVRVGLEDSVYLSKGTKAETNAQQVGKIKRILEELSFEIATPDEAREMLGLKGNAGLYS